MIYLLRLLSRGFTAAERESTAERLERQGWTRCDQAAFLAAWRASDAERAQRLKQASQ